MDGDPRQDPAYRATLLSIRWAQAKTALTFLHFRYTSCYITCRRFRCFYGETMGKYGQFYGQFSTTNNFTKLFVCQLIVEAYRATLLYTKGMDTSATITCPLCNFSKMETMPTDSCQFFYECTNCHKVIKPNKQDCCVFCSYSDSKCPPKLE